MGVAANLSAHNDLWAVTKKSKDKNIMVRVLLVENPYVGELPL